MDNWVQIITFTYPHEAHLVKSKLEAEGIETLIRDELTAQVNNFYSNAIGGVKLLVREHDFERARQILVEAGTIVPQVHEESAFMRKLKKVTAAIPFIGKYPMEIRLIFMVGILLLLLLIPLALLSLPTKTEKLISRDWCIVKLMYLGHEIPVHSSAVELIDPYYKCRHYIRFRQNGTVTFPAIRGEKPAIGHWEVVDDSLKIDIVPGDVRIQVDHEGNIEFDDGLNDKNYYDGIYGIEIQGDRIRLESKDLVIFGVETYFMIKLQ